MRRVGVVTVGRSDYGIYRPVLEAMSAHDLLDPVVFVGGAHLLDRFGMTVREIEADGFPIAARVSFLDADDSERGVAAALGRGIGTFADAFARVRPDLLLVLGDRTEMFAAGAAALPLRIPVAHLHGGETTEGAIDDSFRHALTKLSHLHFAATEEAARRIRQLGEEPWRVTVSGAPALDAISRTTPLTDDQLTSAGVTLRGATLLVTHHPVTLAEDGGAAELDELLAAVDGSELDAVLTYPNADAGHERAIARLEAFARTSDRFTIVRNLGSDAYFTLMARAAAMVGNSSSGIIEAASFRLPVVDVGMRQRGRAHGANVLHAEGTRAAIAEAIGEATSERFRSGLDGLRNPYGDGHASSRIATRLADVELGPELLLKRFHDVGSA